MGCPGLNPLVTLRTFAVSHRRSKKNVHHKNMAAASPCNVNAGAVPTDLRQTWDVRAVLAHILDGSEFQEFKGLFGTSLVTGFGRLHGQLIGILANNGVLHPQSALKGELRRLCSSA